MRASVCSGQNVSFHDAYGSVVKDCSLVFFVSSIFHRCSCSRVSDPAIIMSLGPKTRSKASTSSQSAEANWLWLEEGRYGLDTLRGWESLEVAYRHPVELEFLRNLHDPPAAQFERLNYIFYLNRIRHDLSGFYSADQLTEHPDHNESEWDLDVEELRHRYLRFREKVRPNVEEHIRINHARISIASTVQEDGLFEEWIAPLNSFVTVASEVYNLREPAEELRRHINNRILRSFVVPFLDALGISHEEDTETTKLALSRWKSLSRPNTRAFFTPSHPCEVNQDHSETAKGYRDYLKKALVAKKPHKDFIFHIEEIVQESNDITSKILGNRGVESQASEIPSLVKKYCVKYATEAEQQLSNLSNRLDKQLKVKESPSNVTEFYVRGAARLLYLTLQWVDQGVVSKEKHDETCDKVRKLIEKDSGRHKTALRRCWNHVGWMLLHMNERLIREGGPSERVNSETAHAVAREIDFRETLHRDFLQEHRAEFESLGYLWFDTAFPPHRLVASYIQYLSRHAADKNSKYRNYIRSLYDPKKSKPLVPLLGNDKKAYLRQDKKAPIFSQNIINRLICCALDLAYKIHRHDHDAEEEDRYDISFDQYLYCTENIDDGDSLSLSGTHSHSLPPPLNDSTSGEAGPTSSAVAGPSKSGGEDKDRRPKKGQRDSSQGAGDGNDPSRKDGQGDSGKHPQPSHGSGGAGNPGDDGSGSGTSSTSSDNDPAGTSSELSSNESGETDEEDSTDENGWDDDGEKEISSTDDEGDEGKEGSKNDDNAAENNNAENDNDESWSGISSDHDAGDLQTQGDNGLTPSVERDPTQSPDDSPPRGGLKQGNASRILQNVDSGAPAIPETATNTDNDNDITPLIHTQESRLSVAETNTLRGAVSNRIARDLAGSPTYQSKRYSGDAETAVRVWRLPELREPDQTPSRFTQLSRAVLRAVNHTLPLGLTPMVEDPDFDRIDVSVQRRRRHRVPTRIPSSSGSSPRRASPEDGFRVRKSHGRPRMPGRSTPHPGIGYFESSNAHSSQDGERERQICSESGELVIPDSEEGRLNARDLSSSPDLPPSGRRRRNIDPNPFRATDAPRFTYESQVLGRPSRVPELADGYEQAVDQWRAEGRSGRLRRYSPPREPEDPVLNTQRVRRQMGIYDVPQDIVFAFGPRWRSTAHPRPSPAAVTGGSGGNGNGKRPSDSPEAAGGGQQSKRARLEEGVDETNFAIYQDPAEDEYGGLRELDVHDSELLEQERYSGQYPYSGPWSDHPAGGERTTSAPNPSSSERRRLQDIAAGALGVLGAGTDDRSIHGAVDSEPRSSSGTGTRTDRTGRRTPLSSPPKTQEASSSPLSSPPTTQSSSSSSSSSSSGTNRTKRRTPPSSPPTPQPSSSPSSSSASGTQAQPIFIPETPPDRPSRGPSSSPPKSHHSSSPLSSSSPGESGQHVANPSNNPGSLTAAVQSLSDVEDHVFDAFRAHHLNRESQVARFLRNWPPERVQDFRRYVDGEWTQEEVTEMRRFLDARNAAADRLVRQALRLPLHMPAEERTAEHERLINEASEIVRGERLPENLQTEFPWVPVSDWRRRREQWQQERQQRPRQRELISNSSARLRASAAAQRGPEQGPSSDIERGRQRLQRRRTLREQERQRVRNLYQRYRQGEFTQEQTRHLLEEEYGTHHPWNLERLAGLRRESLYNRHEHDPWDSRTWPQQERQIEQANDADEGNFEDDVQEDEVEETERDTEEDIRSEEDQDDTESEESESTSSGGDSGGSDGSGNDGDDDDNNNEVREESGKDDGGEATEEEAEDEVADETGGGDVSVEEGAPTLSATSNPPHLRRSPRFQQPLSEVELVHRKTSWQRKTKAGPPRQGGRGRPKEKANGYRWAGGLFEAVEGLFV